VRSISGIVFVVQAAAGMVLEVDDCHSQIVDRDRVEIKLDREWANRNTLDPSDPEDMAKIQKALVDFENGIPNPLCRNPADHQLVDWSFEETFKQLDCTKDKLAITQYLASGIEEIGDSHADEIAIEWMGLQFSSVWVKR
jgi:hypothetical protein